MQYFDSSLSAETFQRIGSRLKADVAAAEPRLRALDERTASTPRSAGKWSAKQILGHLIDSAANNHQRFVRAQIVDQLQDPGYAHERWVASQGHAEREWKDLVDFWVVYNRHLAHVIAKIPESRRGTPVSISGDAPVSLSFVALDYVGHIHHHLRQIFA
jgi:hypothetical protein